MPASAYRRWQIDQGAQFRRVYTLKNPDGSPMNLTGYGARLKIAPRYGEEAVLDVTDDSDSLLIVPADGKLWVTLSAATTAALPATEAGSRAPAVTTLVFDLFLTGPDDYVSRPVYGNIDLRREVTAA